MTWRSKLAMWITGPDTWHHVAPRGRLWSKLAVRVNQDRYSPNPQNQNKISPKSPFPLLPSLLPPALYRSLFFTTPSLPLAHCRPHFVTTPSLFVVTTPSLPPALCCPLFFITTPSLFVVTTPSHSVVPHLLKSTWSSLTSALLRRPQRRD
ncbi:hypothetical protein Sjap_001284 [Stephania japonica]|uniref:Uncharacterized protein n=1 Tax=Stephania japonica TaxID=461633 RepID=A0AAP0PTC8_9MAGN